MKRKQMLIQAFIELLSWGLVEGEGGQGWASAGDRWDPLRDGTRVSGPLTDWRGWHWFIHKTFTLHFITVPLPGYKYVICTLRGLSVMIKFTLWLINGAKSDFSAVIGQYMKEQEVGVEVDMCLLGKNCLTCKVKIWNRWHLGKEGEKYVISLGRPWKRWGLTGYVHHYVLVS